jgi:ArsR family transcriptional regulator, arsenate/arsenite/antimonite-responsive transcriptional repressor
MTTSPARLSPRFSEEHDDRILMALSSSVRRRILSLLSHANGTMPVEKLVAHFDLEQPTISHHLAVLVRAHLVSQRQHRNYHYYSVNHATLREAQSIIGGIGRSYADL